MLAEWTIFTQVSGVQRCPRSSRQVAADDLRRQLRIVRARARASARAAPLPLLRVLLLHLLPVPLRRAHRPRNRQHTTQVRSYGLRRRELTL